jgi:purine-binding chemotaxis protein CheW
VNTMSSEYFCREIDGMGKYYYKKKMYIADSFYAAASEGGMMIEEKFANTEETSGIAAEQYVSFILNNETYAIEVLRVKEIVGMTTIRSIPNSDKFLKGVMNLRGTVIPVIDLRIKFGMPEKEYDPLNVILIIEVNNYSAGIIVDSVSDVITAIGPISEIPDFNVNIDREIIQGVFNYDGSLVIILDAVTMLSVVKTEVYTELQ